MKDEIERLRAENDNLRLIATKIMPCHYCGVDSIGKCPHGFPGCSLADDALIGEESMAREIQRLRAELTIRRKSGSASDRLHNLCDAIAKSADGSEWSREEWERIDAEMATLKAQMTADEALLRQALEALTMCNYRAFILADDEGQLLDSITAIRKRLGEKE